MVEMQLGRCQTSGLQLSHDMGYRLKHHPTEPNVLVNQIDSEFIFRPCRFNLCSTGELESADRMCKYNLVIPVERRWKHVLINDYTFIFLVCFLNTTLPFCLPVTDLANRIMFILTLYLLLVTYKFNIGKTLPTLEYPTALDRYVYWSFIVRLCLYIRTPENNSNASTRCSLTRSLARFAVPRIHPCRNHLRGNPTEAW